MSRSIFCYVTNDDNVDIPQILDEVKKEMSRIVDLDLPLDRLTYSKEEALKFYNDKGYTDKANLLAYRPSILKKYTQSC